MKLSFEEIVDMVKISNLETEDESKIIANVQKLIAEKEAEKEEKEGEEKPKNTINTFIKILWKQSSMNLLNLENLH